jgi:hypothetical protein
MVAIGAVGVAVAYFFFGGVAYGANFHVEVKVFAREGVVAIEGNLTVVYFHYLEDRGVVARAAAEAIAHLDIKVGRELGAGYLHGKVVALFAVSVFGGHFNDFFIAHVRAEKLAFEAGDDISRAFQVAQGLAAAGTVENGAAVVGQSIMNRYYACFSHENLRARIGT